MSNRKIYQSLENLGRALKRLKDALNETHLNSLYIDGTIQRFEFTIELYWKTLNRLLALEGIETRTPKESLKQAYASGWIENETPWLQMLRDRNETFHVYDEDMALRIYRNIEMNYPELEITYKKLMERFDYLKD